MNKRKFFMAIGVFLAACLILAAGPADVRAKSLYVIADIHSNPTPIQTWDLQSAPVYLLFQTQRHVPNYGEGGVGMTIDAVNKKLFITYEFSDTIQLLDAQYFTDLGTTIAYGSSDLAGIVVDQSKNRVYAVDRDTPLLYVYDWNSPTNTLTAVAGSPFILAGIEYAYGLALDESRERLYVGDVASTVVHYFSTVDWMEVGNFDLALSGQPPMSIAVDSQRNLVYTGNAVAALGSKGMLVKYDLNTGVETYYTLPNADGEEGDNIVGVTVDEETGYVYTTTGNQYCESGCIDTKTIMVFDSHLNVLRGNIGQIGSPTALVVPRINVGYNPLNFSKEGPATAVKGSNITYSLCYDNLKNTAPVPNVTITDTLPSGVTFVSASGGGTFSGGTVTWNIGTVAAQAPKACVTLTVKVQ